VAPQQIYRALADPTRREILRLLREGDLASGEVAARFAMSWPSVSRHLGVLAGAGLIEAEKRGGHQVYRLTTSVLADIATELADLARLGAETEARGAAAEQEEVRP